MTAAPLAGSVPSIPAPAPRGDWSIVGAVTFTVLVVGGAYAIGFTIAWAVLAVRYGFGAVLEPDFPIWQGGISGLRYSAATMLAIEVLQLGLALIFAGWAGRSRIAALQLGWPRVRPSHWVGFLLLLLAVKAVVTIVTTGLLPTTSARDDMRLFEPLVREQLTSLLFLATVVLAGLTEEIVFRGVLSRTLEESRLGFWAGALVANLGFAVVHTQYGLGGQAVVLAIGMTLSWMRAQTGSIWPGAVCHAANNAIAFIAMRSLAG